MEPSHIPRPHTRSFVGHGRGSGRASSPCPDEVPVVILRVQILSCYDSGANDNHGYSDPFVIVSLLGRRFQTPVSKRNFNPVYAPKDATLDFPLYTSLVHKLGTLEFTVCNNDVVRNNHLCQYALPVDQWFKGTAFAFDDPNNQPFFVDLVSSRQTTTVRGTMCIKVGFVQPPDSKSPPDFGKTYNALIIADKDHVGIVCLDIYGAMDLPKWPNMINTGWDMDPFVQVSIGEEVKRTSVIRHSRYPVWDEQLLFHVREADLSLPMRLTVFNHNRFTSNDHAGEASINIATLVRGSAQRNFNTEFRLHLTGYSWNLYARIPTIVFWASYQSFITLRK